MALNQTNTELRPRLSHSVVISQHVGLLTVSIARMVFPGNKSYLPGSILKYFVPAEHQLQTHFELGAVLKASKPPL